MNATIAPRHARYGCAIVALTSAVLTISACRDIDVVTSAYATLDEARQGGAIDAGIIPDVLPAGAVDIREAHDTATNRKWGLFSFSPADAEPLRRGLREEVASIDGIDCGMPARIEWWPVLLRGRINGEQVKTAGLTAHRARAGRYVVLVNWNQRRAYYWSE
jgi:hypothetical protein